MSALLTACALLLIANGLSLVVIAMLLHERGGGR